MPRGREILGIGLFIGSFFFFQIDFVMRAVILEFQSGGSSNKDRVIIFQNANEEVYDEIWVWGQFDQTLGPLRLPTCFP